MEGEPMIRVYIVTACRSYREALEQVLRRTGTMTVVGSACHPADALYELQQLAPDIVLLDLADGEGPGWARALTESAPEVRVIVVGIREAEADVLAWAEAGVAGYVGIEARLEDLVAAIEGVARGEAACSPRAAVFLLRRIAGGRALGQDDRVGDVVRIADRHLSARESEILRLIGQELSNQQIARRLFISLSTVKNHVHNILRKLGVHRRADAVREMRRAGSVVGAPASPRRPAPFMLLEVSPDGPPRRNGYEMDPPIHVLSE
jgi:DNA-binding NarL/FixJ family response regulator